MTEKKLYIIDNREIILNDEISKHRDDKGFYSDKLSDGSTLFYDENLRHFKNDTDRRAYLKFEMSDIGKGSPYTGFIYTYNWTYNIDEDCHEYNLSFYQYYAYGYPIGIKVVFHENGNINRIINEESSHHLGFEWYENGVLKYEGYGNYLYRKYNEQGELTAEKKYLTEQEKKYRDSFEFSFFHTPSHHFSRRIGYPRTFLKDAETFFNEYRCYSDDERIKKALKNGAEVRPYVPNVLPDNMNPPNAIRKPLLLWKADKNGNKFF